MADPAYLQFRLTAAACPRLSAWAFDTADIPGSACTAVLCSLRLAVSHTQNLPKHHPTHVSPAA